MIVNELYYAHQVGSHRGMQGVPHGVLRMLLREEMYVSAICGYLTMQKAHIAQCETVSLDNTITHLSRSLPKNHLPVA